MKGLLWSALMVAGMLALLGWAIEPGVPSAAMPPAVEAPEGAAVRVVEHFYSWYTNYLASPYSGPNRDPLADGAYRNSPDLHPDFIKKLDRSTRQAADPVLFSADVPRIVSARLDSWSSGGAQVIVRETWSGGFQDLVVSLRIVDGRWKIADVTRTPADDLPADSPERVVRVFYNWYVQYGRQIGNPLIDRVYRAAPLGQTLLQHLDRMSDLAVSVRIEDPVLISVGMPLDYRVAPVAVDCDGAAYQVIERLPGGEEQTVDVVLERENGRWVIARIAEAE